MNRIVIGFLLIGGTFMASGCGSKPEDVREAIRQADIAFDRAVADKDIEAFAELVALDAVFYGTGLAEGRDAIVQRWKAYFEPEPQMTLRWSPDSVEASASGDLGYTRGSYEMTVRDDAGGVQRLAGSYVTIWRRGEDGRWRAAVDIGTPPQPATDGTSPSADELD